MALDPCPNCNSTNWTNNHDGNERCQQCGFLRPISLEDNSDEGEYVLSMGTRTVKKKEKRAKATKYFTGVERNRFHLLVLQLILRRQLWQLTHELGLPKELEELVRALWECNVEKLAEARLLDETVRVEFSSQDLSASETEDDGVKQALRPISMSRMPNIGDTIILCYLGCLILRLPIFLGDFRGWIMDGKLLYLNAYDAIPEPMRERMDNFALRRTVRRKAIEDYSLSSRAFQRILGMERDMGLQVPPLNFPLVLMRLIRELALPLEVYTAAKVIAKITENDFNYPTEAVKTAIRKTPDWCAAGCLVTAVKVLYPFDGKKRPPTNKSEPAVAVIDWKQWEASRRAKKEQLSTGESSQPLTHTQGMEITEIDAMYMDDQQVDRYLDWFEDTFIDTRPFMFKEDKDAFTRETLQLFPTHSRKIPAPISAHDPGRILADQDAAIKATQANLVITKPSTAKGVLSPGDKIDAIRDLHGLPSGPASTFHLAVAELVGMPVHELLLIVRSNHRAARLWLKGKSNSMRGGQSKSK